MFNNNIANSNGGGIHSVYGYLSFKENSSTAFNNNIANINGGGIFSSSHSYMSFKGNSCTVFNNNTEEVLWTFKD